MKRILVHTAISTDAGAYADSGSVLAIPDDLSAERAKELVASGSAAEHFDDVEETPKSKAKA